MTTVHAEPGIHAGGEVVPAPDRYLRFNGIAVLPERNCGSYNRKTWTYTAKTQRAEIMDRGDYFTNHYGDPEFDPDAKLHVEHIVALKEAADSGLCLVDRDTKQAFARDIANQVMSLPSLNSRKGARDAAEWLPPEARV